MLKTIGIIVGISVLALGAMAFRSGVDSGLKVGEMVSAFEPHHVAGPLKGTNSCPPCTYGNRPAVQAWVTADEPMNVVAMAKLLDKMAVENKKADLKTFVIVVTDKTEYANALLTRIADGSNLKEVHLATLSPNDEAVKNYKFNLSPEVKNTVFVYKNRKVEAKYVNVNAREEGLIQPLVASVEKITS